MRKISAILLAAILAVPVAYALTVTNNPQEFVYGRTVNVDTDATGAGTLSVYAPTQAGDCKTFKTSAVSPSDGVITGVPLDRSGPWTVVRENGVVLGTTTFTVAPDSLRILASKVTTAKAGIFDYSVVVVKDGQAVAGATVDLYFGSNEYVRTYIADGNGRITILNSVFHHLPYAGSYTLKAYRDLDVNGAGQTKTYTQPFVFTADPDCATQSDYDAPELYGTGPELTTSFQGIVRIKEPINIQVQSGDLQVRGVDRNPTVLRTTDPEGNQLRANRIRFISDGAERTSTQLGLTATLTMGQVSLDGQWLSDSDLTIILESDDNGDGNPEYGGQFVLPIQQGTPIRLETREGTDLHFQVPPRQPDGRPGKDHIYFEVFDQANAEGKPPVLPVDARQRPTTMNITGDVLGDWSIEWDAAKDMWHAAATPKNSDSRYFLNVKWPAKGIITVTVDGPSDGGARTTLTQPIDGSLTYATPEDAAVLVERFNKPASDNNMCTPLPGCAYERVVDAKVEILWADTGQTVCIYNPGSHGTTGSCSILQLDGKYFLHDFNADRSGPLAAFVTINAFGTPRHSYTDIPVLPKATLTPEFNPSLVLAGERKAFQITSGPGFTQTTYLDHDVRIMDSAGNTLATETDLTVVAGKVVWQATLPEGTYSLRVTEKLDAANSKLGRFTTLTPGILSVEPASVTFAYTNSSLLPSKNIYGVDLRQDRAESFVLGSSFGRVNQMRVAAIAPDGDSSRRGTISLDGTQSDGSVAALFAISDQNTPVSLPLRSEETFAPSEPDLVDFCQSAASNDCRAFYTVTALGSAQFTPKLDIQYTGQPVLVYVWGTGVGDVIPTFRATSSSLNTAQPADSILHVVPPYAEVDAVNTRLGKAVTPVALTVAEENAVSLRLRDPTGASKLADTQIGLQRDVFGPGQRPGGMVNYAAGADYGTALLSVVPDATGSMHIVAYRGLAIVDTLSVLPSLHASQILYQNDGNDVLVEIPTQVNELTGFQVRVATKRDPTPVDVRVDVFNATYTLIAGSLTINAPSVEAEQTYSATIRVAGYPAQNRMIKVLNVGTQLKAMSIAAAAEVDEAASLAVTVTSNGAPLEGVKVQLGSNQANTNAAGLATLTAPSVTSNQTINILATKTGYNDVSRPILVRNLGGSSGGGTTNPPTGATTPLPAHFSSAQTSVEGGLPTYLTILADPSYDFPANIAAWELTAGTQTVTLSRTSDAELRGLWTPPQVYGDVQVMLILRSPGHDPIRQVVTIEGVTP